MRISEMVKLSLEEDGEGTPKKSFKQKAKEQYDKVAGAVGSGYGKAAGAVGRGYGKAVGAVAGSKPVQMTQAQWEKLSPEAKKRVKTGGKLAGLAAATLASYGGYKHFTKTPTEKAVHAAGSIKDVIKNKISENPKAAMAAGGAAAALGAGYGTYKYLKNRKK